MSTLNQSDAYTAITTIHQLKRIWSKATHRNPANKVSLAENEQDHILIDMLGTGLLPTFRFLHHHQPGFEDFLKWILANTQVVIDETFAAQCNNLFSSNSAAQQVAKENVLTPEDILFWEEEGYVIVREAVTKQDAAEAREAILVFLDMHEDDAASWYKESAGVEGIMVNLYSHPALNKNRTAPRIRRAFEQLWGDTALVATADKCGFNPPETGAYRYRGIGLHWDVSLATPIPFGTQGILYLTDTAANQGALTVVPGFHKNIEQWLHGLPLGTDARQTDFSGYEKKAVSAAAGDLIIWNHKLPHGASANRAALPRIVQYINWYNPAVKPNPVWK